MEYPVDGQFLNRSGDPVGSPYPEFQPRHTVLKTETFERIMKVVAYVEGLIAQDAKVQALIDSYAQRDDPATMAPVYGVPRMQVVIDAGKKLDPEEEARIKEEITKYMNSAQRHLEMNISQVFMEKVVETTTEKNKEWWTFRPADEPTLTVVEVATGDSGIWRPKTNERSYRRQFMVKTDRPGVTEEQIQQAPGLPRQGEVYHSGTSIDWSAKVVRVVCEPPPIRSTIGGELFNAVVLYSTEPLLGAEADEPAVVTRESQE